jgi:hypothetical protein
VLRQGDGLIEQVANSVGLIGIPRLDDVFQNDG